MYLIDLLLPLHKYLIHNFHLLLLPLLFLRDQAQERISLPKPPVTPPLSRTSSQSHAQPAQSQFQSQSQYTVPITPVEAIYTAIEKPSMPPPSPAPIQSNTKIQIQQEEYSHMNKKLNLQLQRLQFILNKKMNNQQHIYTKA
jgi:hypothetical protein